MTHEPTRPNAETRAAEQEDAARRAGADRAPDADEEARADELHVDPDVAAHEEDMAERGVRQQGEGRID